MCSSMPTWLLHNHSLEILTFLDFGLDFFDERAEVWCILCYHVSRVISSFVLAMNNAPLLAWSVLIWEEVDVRVSTVHTLAPV
jgi:hypothetical protein